MPAYEEELVVGTEETDEVKTSGGLFYSGMSEEEKLKLLNSLANRIDVLDRDALKKDTRSIEDKLTNKNSLDPGHGHFAENIFGKGATDGYVLTAPGGDGSAAFEAVPGPENIEATLAAGETISAGNAVALCPVPIIDVNYDQTHQQNATDGYPLGGNAGYEFLAQEFIAGATSHLMQVGLYLKKNGSPTDNINVEIWSDNSNVPGVKLCTITLAGSTLTGSFAWYTVYLGDFIPVVSGTNYHLVLSRSGANDADNYYVWAADISTSSPAHSSGYTTTSDATRVLRRGATATTVATISVGVSPHSDAIFKTYKADTATAVLRQTRGTSDFLTKNFIGFAPSAISNGASGSVIRQGLVTGLSGLSPGLLYYLSDTAGAISTSSGTYNAPVLVAKTATTGETISLQPRVPSISPRYACRNTETTSAILENGAAQTNYSITIPANTLGANGVLRYRIWGQMTLGEGYLSVWYGNGSRSTGDFRINEGAIEPGATPFYFEGTMSNRNATNSQVATATLMAGATDDAVDLSTINLGTIDTTADQKFDVVVSRKSSSAMTMIIDSILIEVLK